MSVADPAAGTPAALAGLQAALQAAIEAPAPSASSTEEDDNADISTPRAKAASALEAALRARLDWYWEREERTGERLCRQLLDMCAWHEHPQLREKVLDLQRHGIAILAANPDGQPNKADAGDIEDAYESIKPSADDGSAIAAALGMSLEEAQAFGLVGTLSDIGFEEEESVRVAAGVDDGLEEEEEDLETLFRREALTAVTRTLPQALQRFWSDQRSMDAMITVRRGFHTLKGDARTTAQSTTPEVAVELEGLAVLSEAAEDIIDYLLGDDYDTNQPAPNLPSGAFSLLNETASALAKRLESHAPLENEAALLRRLEAMQRKAAAQSGVPIDDATLAAKLATPRPKAAQPPKAAPVAQPAARPVPKSSSTSLLPTFLDEAARLLPDLHRALGMLSKEPANEGALVRARVKLHTLKGGAALIGDEAAQIQMIAHAGEDLLELIEDFQLRGELSEVPPGVLDGVLDAEDMLQSLIDTLSRARSSGRLSQPSTAPAELAERLNALAERVRRGEMRPASTPTAPMKLTPPSVLPELSVSMSVPVRSVPATRPKLALPGRRALTAVTGLRETRFRDIVESNENKTIRSRTAVIDRVHAVEERARRATSPFALFTCVQEISNYMAEQARYRELAGEKGQIYVFGKLDVTPRPEQRITIVPLEEGDVLLAERAAIFDAPEQAAAFFAFDTATEGVQAGRRFMSLAVEDPVIVREAAARLRGALRQDASLIAVRRIGLQSDSAIEPASTSRSRPLRPRQRETSDHQFGKDYSVKTALSALEDLSVSRDALQELLARMTYQRYESRRSGQRLRNLVGRVAAELAGLRSELVRTTRHAGDWDLLEKEEYTTVDVLLMQLDEALADLEESDTNIRRDLAEARAQVEIQADNQLRAQRSLLDMSMIPLSQIEDRLAHAVRSQSRKLNKQVAFSMEGGDLMLDGRIAESLFEPLMHLINNALDHGIESAGTDRIAAAKPVEGHLTIRGRASGDGVAIDVVDDGRGMDPERMAAVAVSRGIVSPTEAAAMSANERIALIWRPGFSTASSVTTISGRGIGMKSVLDDVTSLQGRIEVHSVLGEGTTFTITLPRSLAMLRVEVVREGRDLVAIPITQVLSSHPIAYRDLQEMPAGATIALGEKRLTIYGTHLANGPVGDGDAGQAMLLEVTGRTGCIVVDEVMGSQYLPVRAAPGYLRRQCGLLGYAVGGGGRILPILDLPTLIDRTGADQPVVAIDSSDRPAYSVLVVDDSQTMRRALRDTLSKAGFLVREAADGREALATCGRAMPDLITLDMEMPGMDGLEALAALRLLPNGGATVPIFMITSRQQARHRAAALAAGVTRYFTKPYDQEELVGAAFLVLAEGAHPRRDAAS